MAGVLTWKSRFGGVFGNNKAGNADETGDEQETGIPRWSLGVLNDRHTTEVPGSVYVFASHHDDSVAPADEAKATADGTILNPQPEESPNDPLNWPAWRRDCALLVLGIYCMVGGGMTPLLAAGFNNVAEDYHVDTEKVSLTTGLYMMGMGLGSVVFSPTAILYGKRPVYLFSAVLFTATSVWAALSPNFTSLILARIFQGAAVSPVECLPSATISEIFFLHERAFRIGIYTLLLLGGKNLVPLVSAVVIQALGWRWVFWVVTIVVVLCGVLLFFFVPETFWDRIVPTRARYRAPQASAGALGPGHDGQGAQDAEKRAGDASDPSRPGSAPRHSDTSSTSTSRDDFAKETSIEAQKFPTHSTGVTAPPGVLTYTEKLRQQPARSFTQLLKPWNGRLKRDAWFKVMLRPFVLFAYPAVLWSSVVYSLSVGWLIVVSESVALIYRNRESYNFDALQTGLVYLSPFVGGVLGTAVAGKVSDMIVKTMARRNGGLYEPEFRLVMIAPVAVTTVIGLMGFGWSAQERDHWIVPTVFFGLIAFGCTLGSTTAITFCVDSYRQYAGEALVTLNFSKNIFHGLVFSLFVTHWITDKGPKMVFIWLGVIHLIFLFLTIPMYLYGKRARMWTVRKNLMEKL